LSQLGLNNAGVGRRLAAFTYDSLVTCGVLLAASIAFVPFLHGGVLTPMEPTPLTFLYYAWILGWIAAYFGYCWTRNGQTVGMLAWRLKLIDSQNRRVTWPAALKRVAVAYLLWAPVFVGYWALFHGWPSVPRKAALAFSLLPVVAAYLWIWIDKERLAWPDRWTRTRVVVLAKRKKGGE
jgi:uncharacterized RDD family membrane protein YckC